MYVYMALGHCLCTHFQWKKKSLCHQNKYHYIRICQKICKIFKHYQAAARRRQPGPALSCPGPPGRRLIFWICLVYLVYLCIDLDILGYILGMYFKYFFQHGYTTESYMAQDHLYIVYCSMFCLMIAIFCCMLPFIPDFTTCKSLAEASKSPLRLGRFSEESVAPKALSSKTSRTTSEAS